MSAIRTLIVDDEPLARENLRIRLRDIQDFEIVGESATGREAIEAIAALKPELVFLDIQMPDLNGFDVIDLVPPETLPVIVFVTAYDRYALEAFRVHALDYLLKPFENDRFEETLQSCRERVEELRRASRETEKTYQFSGVMVGGEKEAGGAAYLDRLVIKTRGRVFFLRTDLLEWIEANGDYSRLHAGERNYLLRKTMNEMEMRLSPERFVRVSRSAIVNLDRIRELRPASRGEYLIHLAGGHQVKLTRTYRERLETRLGDRL